MVPCKVPFGNPPVCRCLPGTGGPSVLFRATGAPLATRTGSYQAVGQDHAHIIHSRCFPLPPTARSVRVCHRPIHVAVCAGSAPRNALRIGLRGFAGDALRWVVDLGRVRPGDHSGTLFNFITIT